MEQAYDENFETSASQTTNEVENGQGDDDGVEFNIVASQIVEQIKAKKMVKNLNVHVRRRC